ncbi:hypothetical protein [Actinomycetospora atypica]|uniref:PE domain-containing protein n=1 Tax=Actinomycetospora atypica TaxID=1290095 RepID=A0ABV9YNC7_9PSEU
MSTPVPPPGLYREPSRGVPAFLPTPAPQASDPTVLADGRVIPRHLVPAPSGAGGSFSIDLERAPQVLRDLRDAIAQLNDLRRDAFQLGKVDPGTNDLVSKDAAAVLGAVAVGGAGSFVDAVTAGIERLEGIVSAIENEIRSYRATDDQARRSFGALS